MRLLANLLSRVLRPGIQLGVELDSPSLRDCQVSGVVEIRGLPAAQVHALRIRVLGVALLPRKDFPMAEERTSVLGEARVAVDLGARAGSVVRVPFTLALAKDGEAATHELRERMRQPGGPTIRHRVEVEAELPFGRRALASVEA
jgi:hypothetical protein